MKRCALCSCGLLLLLAASAGGCGKSGKSGEAGKAPKDVKAAPLPAPATPRWRLAWSHHLDSSLSGLALLTGGGAVQPVVATSTSDKVSLLLAGTGQEMGRVKTQGQTSCLAASPDGKLLAVGYEQGPVRLIDRKTHSVTTLPKSPGAVRGLAFGPRGKKLAAVSEDGTLLVYDVGKGALLHSVKGPKANGLWSVTFRPDAKGIVAGGYRQIFLFDLAKGAFAKTISVLDGNVESLSFRRDGKRLAVASERQAQILDTANWKPVQAGGALRPPAVYDPSGQWLAVGTRDKHVVLRSVATGKVVSTLAGAADAGPPAFTPDGRTLAVTQKGGSGYVRLYLFDKLPDLGVSVRQARWLNDDGPALRLELAVVGAVPARTVAYGHLTGLKAVDDQGRPVKSISTSLRMTKWLSQRDRQFGMTDKDGFSFPVTLHGLSGSVKGIARLEGTFVMYESRGSETLTFDNLSGLMGKPLAHPTLKKMGLVVTPRRGSEGGVVVSYKGGRLGQLETVKFLDTAGKSTEVSAGMDGGSAPTWQSPTDPAKMKGWKLQLFVNPQVVAVRGRFRLEGIRIPGRDK